MRAAALLCLLAGLVLVGYGVAAGDVRVGLFLIIPFVYGTGPAAALGMLLVFAALVLWMLSRIPRGPPVEPFDGEMRTQTKSGGVVLLGPIPIVWGSDRRVLPWMVAAGAALLLLGLWLTWTLR